MVNTPNPFPGSENTIPLTVTEDPSRGILVQIAVESQTDRVWKLGEGVGIGEAVATVSSAVAVDSGIGVARGDCWSDERAADGLFDDPQPRKISIPITTSVRNPPTTSAILVLFIFPLLLNSPKNSGVWTKRTGYTHGFCTPTPRWQSYSAGVTENAMGLAY
jgi:hypothetical protein